MDNCNWLHMILNPTHRQLWGWQILTEEDGLLLGTRTSQHPPGPHCVFSDSNSGSFIFIILLFKFNGITHARGGSISAILHNYTLQQKRLYQNCCILIHEKCWNTKYGVWMHDSIYFLKPHRPQWLKEMVNTFKFKQGPPSPSYIIHGLFALGKQQTEGGNKQWWNVWNPTPHREVWTKVLETKCNWESIKCIPDIALEGCVQTKKCSVILRTVSPCNLTRHWQSISHATVTKVNTRPASHLSTPLICK